MPKIRKAVFPVAGLGTRFLPATKVMPKELLTIVDKPVIQHVVEEARAAGIEHFIFVTAHNKSMIQEHFTRQPELEKALRERGKQAELDALTRDLPDPRAFSYTLQESPLGLGHAVWCARELVGREPFALLLPDMLVHAKKSCLAQMIEVFATLPSNANLIAVEEVPDDRVQLYGAVGVGKAKGAAFEITGMVEKPARGAQPSNRIITGRYILQPEIFDELQAQERGAGSEIQLTDAMLKLMAREPFFGFLFEGSTFDCGSKTGFLAANVAYALARPDLAPAFRAELEALLNRR
jgi:UTP--glucose-1-phosphate uridylyltransferase